VMVRAPDSSSIRLLDKINLRVNINREVK
jgi:hypothetical protein